MRGLKTKQGITLIALVITVIVMLILAGVAINLTVGDNGIFKKSDEGAKIYKNAANNEATSLNGIDKEMGDLLEQYQNGSKPGKPGANGIYTQNSTINGGKAEAFNPEIPKGFKPVNVDTANWGDGTNPPTEEAVKAGLVIEDEEGNQFVWIAVDGTEIELKRYVFTTTGEIDTTLTKTEPTDGLKGYEAQNPTVERLKGDTSVASTNAIDIEGFRTSVEEHGGYYIARYEASYGTDKKPNSKVSTGEPATSNGAPTVEGQLWNNITQPSAAEACRKMYDSSYGITSDLMNSYAWDTAIVFIQKYSGDNDYSIQESLNTTLANTGTIGDEKCHIHDMASNCWEWTTENSNALYYPCVSRGYTKACGRRSYYGTSDTLGLMVSDDIDWISFRPILYL